MATIDVQLTFMQFGQVEGQVEREPLEYREEFLAATLKMEDQQTVITAPRQIIFALQTRKRNDANRKQRIVGYRLYANLERLPKLKNSGDSLALTLRLHDAAAPGAIVATNFYLTNVVELNDWQVLKNEAFHYILKADQQATPTSYTLYYIGEDGGGATDCNALCPTSNVNLRIYCAACSARRR